MWIINVGTYDELHINSGGVKNLDSNKQYRRIMHIPYPVGSISITTGLWLALLIRS